MSSFHFFSASTKRKKSFSFSASKKFKQSLNTDDDELGKLLLPYILYIMLTLLFTFFYYL